jgi:hypothetical protein
LAANCDGVLYRHFRGCFCVQIMSTVLKPLDLFRSTNTTGTADADIVLRGSAGADLYALTKTHTVHRHAAGALHENVLMHPLVWMKKDKGADPGLTPSWAITAVTDALDSFLSVGYAVYTVRAGGVVEVGVPTNFDLHFCDGQWQILVDTATTAGGKQQVAEKWELLLWNAPVRYSKTKVIHNSPCKRAYRDTKIFDELYRNHRQKDHFNSHPAVFTVVDRNLKNVNGSNRQWFQSSTASTAAASRTTAVDSNFQYLVHSRAQSVKALQTATGLYRTGSTTLAGEDKPIEDAVDQKQHLEHIVTDGRECTPSRALLSLTDGHRVLQDSENKIYFHLGVPPQIQGRNINAERSGVNPRLNEIALSQFFNMLQRLRAFIEAMFADPLAMVANAVLKFQPCLSPYELEKLQPFIKEDKLPSLYAAAYHVPESFFDKAKFERLLGPGGEMSGADNFKRKRADDAPHSDAATSKQASKIQRAGSKEGVR